jgi:hypothetical protein
LPEPAQAIICKLLSACLIAVSWEVVNSISGLRATKATPLRFGIWRRHLYKPYAPFLSRYKQAGGTSLTGRRFRAAYPLTFGIPKGAVFGGRRALQTSVFQPRLFLSRSGIRRLLWIHLRIRVMVLE